MSKSSNITQQACAWIAKLNESELSENERSEFEAWMTNSKEHRAEIRRVAKQWEDLNSLTMLAVPSDHKKPESEQGMSLFRPATVSFGLASIAAISLFVLTTLNVVDWSNKPAEHYVAQELKTSTSEELESYSTEIGEQRLITLPDGSTVLLNTDSRFSVAYDSNYRDIYLIEGEAHFDVESNRERPFRVFAGKSKVRAVGTAFSVHLKKTTVDVTVTHGSVEIDSIRDSATGSSSLGSGQSPVAPSIVSAGHSAKFDLLIGSIETVALSEASLVPAWHEGKLKFTGEPLAEVVEEISRYSTLSIVILDSDLRNLRIGGLFDTGETEKMFEALENGFNIEVEYINDRLVHLKSPKPESND